MNNQTENFNLEQAKKFAKDYTKATGIECLLIKNNGIYNPCPGAVHKEFCFEKDSEIAKYCLNTHANGAASAKNKEHCVSYFCPMGLMHWTAPIVVDGQIEGTFIAGHVFFDNAKENVIKRKRLSELHEKLLLDYPELKESLLSSMVIDEERLDGLKHILTLMAENLSPKGQVAPKSIAEIELLLTTEKVEFAELKSKDTKWFDFAEAIFNNDPQAIEESLNLITHAIEKESSDLEIEKSELTNLILILHKKYSEDEENNYLTEHCISAISEINFIKSKDVLSLWIKKNVRMLLESAYYLPSIKNADMIYSALHYIHTQYSEKITLQEISDYVHFSPPYFSKMFKKELNMTFIQYLTKTRVEKSKELLADISIPLPDIPGMVGFEEQSYFTKVFRTITGMSPGKYRDQITA